MFIETYSDDRKRVTIIVSKILKIDETEQGCEIYLEGGEYVTSVEEYNVVKNKLKQKSNVGK